MKKERCGRSLAWLGHRPPVPEERKPTTRVQIPAAAPIAVVTIFLMKDPPRLQEEYKESFAIYGLREAAPNSARDMNGEG